MTVFLKGETVKLPSFSSAGGQVFDEAKHIHKVQFVSSATSLAQLGHLATSTLQKENALTRSVPNIIHNL